jgi:hypothetical protein
VLAPSDAAPALPVLSSDDVALLRARTLYARGRLPEALRALRRVAPGSALRPDADALRIEIQQVLLASALSAPRRIDPAATPGAR